jgi:hypothetical protein
MEPGGNRSHDRDTLTALFLIILILRNFKLFRLLKKNEPTDKFVGYATSYPGVQFQD